MNTTLLTIKGDCLLQRREVEQIVGAKKSALYSWIEKGEFPRGHQINNSRTVRWRLSEVHQWMEDQRPS